ncbi:helix-turn-helix transcriptional regulator [Paenibacillus kandeliae]|uniref:helix-turn-helix transcriptional regulator n=1 Tax=Paenibacillus kandeliae TaxID=3231269 RepID=UPI003457867E
MEHRALLSNYLSNLKVELITANHSLCAPDWRELDYIPDYSKFYFICEGEGWLKIGDQEYYPQPGELFLMPEGVKQSYSFINERPFRKYWCHFTAYAGGINLFKLLNVNPQCRPQQPEIVQHIFSEMVQYAHSQEVYARLLAKSKVTELISHYMMNLTRNADTVSLKNEAVFHKLTMVLAYIDEHIMQNMTIEELSSILYMHPNSFIRMFKQYVGMPPIQYITRQKIENAKQMLTMTTMPIAEIAHQLGFNDTFYFSKQFKKYTGLAPSDYRKYVQEQSWVME